MKKFLLTISSAVFLVAGVGTVITAKEAFDKGFIPEHLEEITINEEFESASNLNITGDYNFTVEQGTDDLFHITGEGLKNKSHQFTYEKVDDTFNVIVTNSKKWYQEIEIFNWDFLNKRVHATVTVPQSFNGNINIKTSSADIKVAGVNAKELTLKSSSASIKANDIIADNINISNSSGNITLTNVGASNLNLNVSSGSVKVENDASHPVTNVNAKVSSGSIRLTGTFDNIITNASSGGTTLKLDKMPTKLEAKASSGSVHLYLDGKFNVYGKVSSGSKKIRGDSEAAFIDDTLCNIAIRVSSGNINIWPRS